MKKDIPTDRLDPARTALVMVHMVKAWPGSSTPPSTDFFDAEPRRKDSWESRNAYWTVPHGQGKRHESGLHRSHIPARAPRGQSEFSAVAQPLRLCLPDGEYSRRRAHGRTRPPAR
jgi:hypothetical protein